MCIYVIWNNSDLHMASLFLLPFLEDFVWCSFLPSLAIKRCLPTLIFQSRPEVSLLSGIPPAMRWTVYHNSFKHEPNTSLTSVHNFLFWPFLFSTYFFSFFSSFTFQCLLPEPGVGLLLVRLQLWGSWLDPGNFWPQRQVLVFEGLPASREKFLRYVK